MEEKVLYHYVIEGSGFLKSNRSISRVIKQDGCVIVTGGIKTTEKYNDICKKIIDSLIKKFDEESCIIKEHNILTLNRL